MTDEPMKHDPAADGRPDRSIFRKNASTVSQMTDTNQEQGDTRELVLSLRGISKNFGAVSALTDIDLDVHAGEVVALVGDNGAGKSTLVKILAGVHQQTSGTIRFGGREVALTDPSAALNLGIATVFQDLALC